MYCVERAYTVNSVGVRPPTACRYQRRERSAALVSWRCFEAEAAIVQRSMQRVPQSVFTFSASIVEGAVSELTRVLSLSHDGDAALRCVPGLHFARFVIVPQGCDALGERLPATLVFSSWCDGPLPQHVEALARHAHDFF